MDNKTKRIRELNDAFRTSFEGGRVMITQGVQALDQITRSKLLMAVKAFDKFDHNNDPHHEHYFGAVELEGERCFWKIDHYSPTLDVGSDDPSDPAKTCRVMTIMCASEY